MSLKNIFYALISITCISLTGCSDDEPAGLISPSDANALSNVLILPDQTTSESGTPPATTISASTPEVTNLVNDLVSSNGSTTPLVFNYSNTNNDLAGCYVQIAGSNRFFAVPYTSTAGRSGQLSLPIGIPTNVDEGSFTVNFCVYNNQGEVSNVVSTSVDVLRLGTGSVQISLSWDNSSDQDLYVTDPEGSVISYLRDSAPSGGQLDRDDTDGFGPENIFWTESAPDGAYSVEVNHYSGTAPTNFYVTINGFGTTRTFEGRTTRNRVNVATFTKQGNRINF